MSARVRIGLRLLRFISGSAGDAGIAEGRIVAGMPAGVQIARRDNVARGTAGG
jgi:hypothetical protein